MPAQSSPPSPPQASTTSSGFADGLGRRALAFDREEGVMLERLVLRPELGAFEAMLRERLDRLAALEDERIARPRTIERGPDGSLVVVCEFVPGSRLGDLLDTAAQTGATPGVDAALGFLLDVLPALCGLHAGAGFAHGSISPSRTVLTPAGQVVLLDAIYGGALAHLRYSRRKLWTEFTVATSPRLPAQRIHVETDLAQAALAAVMLVVGRPLEDGEYPDRLSGVVREVCDVAQIRGSAAFAAGLQSFVHRALQLGSSAAYVSADDALFDVRELANELGAHVCRRALVDFIEQMESPAQPRRGDQVDDLAEEIARFGLAAAYQEVAEIGEEEQDLEAHVDAELDLDRLVEGGGDDLEPITPIEISEDTSAADVTTEEAVDWVAAAAESTRDEAAQIVRPAEPEAIPLSKFVLEAPAPEAILVAPAPVAPPVVEPAAAATPAPTLDEPAGASPPAPASLDVAAEDGDETPAHEDIAEPVPAVRSRRSKRPIRSARARKDKLRSVAETAVPDVMPEPDALPPPPPPAPPPPAPAPKPSSPWLVSPNTAAAFEPAVPDPPAAPVFVPMPMPAEPPAMPQFALAPAVPMYTAPPMTPVPLSAPAPPEPVFSRTVGAVAPSYDSTPPWTPPPAPPSAPPPVFRPQTPAPLKLKDSPRPRAARPEPSLDIYSTPSSPVDHSSSTSGFPWKLAAALAVIVVGAIIGGRMYTPTKVATAPDEETTAPATSAAAPAAPPAALPGATTGRLEIETQPAGARVLLDGKPSGESPIALESIAAGRHTITLVSPSGSIKRTVRIEAGRTAKLDVPIFSGWVGIFAPFVVEVSEGGKVIGTTEESRLMLSPGRHELTLSNRELAYNGSRTVDIEPGEVRSITLDPRGAVNFNASPWAEVWIDGRKVGDTPIANMQLPLGIREVVFRHPQLGERRASVTVKGDGPAAVTIDFTKPGQ
jgi:hypothetical protein